MPPPTLSLTLPCGSGCPAGFELVQQCRDTVVEFIVDSENSADVTFTPPISFADGLSLWDISASTRVEGYFGSIYYFSRRQSPMAGSVLFDFVVAAPGRYRVSVSYATKSNRHSAVPTEIAHQGGSTTVLVNQRVTASDCRETNLDGSCHAGFESVGEYSFTDGGSVTIHHRGFGTEADPSTYGTASVDAVSIVPVSPELANPIAVVTCTHDVPLTTTLSLGNNRATDASPGHL